MGYRFSIRFDSLYAKLSSILGLFPSSSYLDVGDGEVSVRMAWAFRARFPKTAVASAQQAGSAPLSRGVHGFGGRWLVNGSSGGIVTIDLSPDQRAYVMGFPVRLSQLMISVTEPEALVAALAKR